MSDGFLDERRPTEIKVAIMNLWAIESTEQRFKNYSFKGGQCEYGLSIQDRFLTSAELVEERLLAANRRLRILDLGAGACRPLIHLREVFGDQVDLVAVSAHSARIFSQKSQSDIKACDIDFRTGNAEFWKRVVDPDESFDIVFSRYGIRWFCDPLAAIERILSQLKPGGIFWADPLRIPSDRDTSSRLRARLDALAMPLGMSRVDGYDQMNDFCITKASDSKEPVFTDFQYDDTVRLLTAPSFRPGDKLRRQASYTTVTTL